MPAVSGSCSPQAVAVAVVVVVAAVVVVWRRRVLRLWELPKLL